MVAWNRLIQCQHHWNLNCDDQWDSTAKARMTDLAEADFVVQVALGKRMVGCKAGKRMAVAPFELPASRMEQGAQASAVEAAGAAVAAPSLPSP